MTAKRTPAQLEREFNDVVPELASAIKALIRGYLPPELRKKEFTLSIEIKHDKAASKVARRK